MSHDGFRHEAPREVPEEVLESLMEQLPDELADRWQMAFEAPSSAYSTVEKKIAKIKEVIDRREGKIFDESTLLINERFTNRTEIVEMCLNAMVEVNQVIGVPEFKLGSGKTATVFRLKTAPNMCVKFIHSSSEYQNQRKNNYGNTIEQEVAILRSLEGIRLNTVRVPEFYFLLPQGLKMGYVMEGFNAIAMEEVLLHEHSELISRLDVDAFVDSLVEFAKALHAQDLIHMDLHPGNVMIDPVTLEPRVIDFGRSKYLSTLDEDVRERMLKIEFHHRDKLRAELHARKSLLSE